jgi:beta-1,2-mannobiose phosphorylase / 1,2-beta-oligomannan phosphorylase
MISTPSSYGVIMQPEDKDAALLPRRINGCWALIHCPVTTSNAPYSSDLRNWGGHIKILEARLGGWWDANKISLSPSLI